MTEAARALLATFETLSPSDQQEVAAEILRRASPGDDRLEEDLLSAADELFQGYDAEEAAHGGP